MKFLKKLVLANVFLAASITSSYACDIGARVSIVGNEFPAIQTVGAGAQECSGAEVKTNLTADHQKINVAGMQGNPAEFIANFTSGALVPTKWHSNTFAKSCKMIRLSELFICPGPEHHF